MENTEYKQEIENTRVGCLGSSDAQLVLSAGRSGVIGKQLKRRLAIVAGFIPNTHISTYEMRRGNAAEQAIFDNVHARHANATSNPLYVYMDRGKYRVIDHIDIEVVGDTLSWVEIKTSLHTPQECVDTYRAQLAWHTMCCATRAMELGCKDYDISFLHFPAERANYDDETQTCQNIDMSQAQTFGFSKTEFEHDIADIQAGFQLIDEFMETFDHYDAIKTISADELPQDACAIFERIEVLSNEQKCIDAELKELKAAAMELMRAGELDTVQTPLNNISYVSPRVLVRFDSKRFKLEQPDMYNQFMTKCNVAESISVTARKD